MGIYIHANKDPICLILHSFTASECIKLRVTEINIKHLFISYSFILYKKKGIVFGCDEEEKEIGIKCLLVI